MLFLFWLAPKKEKAISNCVPGAQNVNLKGRYKTGKTGL
jgi:hypothetical protein